jgi:protocatechuate 3,4-dioxygenase beta subunit
MLRPCHNSRRIGMIPFPAFVRRVPIPALFLLLFFSVSAGGQTRAVGDSSRINVRVIHQGLPVKGADVFLGYWRNWARDGVDAAATRVGRTSGEGAISVPVLMLHGRIQGVSWIAAQVPGSLAGFTELFIYTDPDSVVIRLFPSRTVSGVVRDDRGRPIPDAVVAVWYMKGNGDSDREDISLSGSIPGSSAKSDSQGRFVISDIPESSRIDIKTIAPGRSELMIRDVPAGMNNLEIALEPESRIKGRVTFETGEPVKRIRVVAQSKISGRDGADGATDDNGYYIIDRLLSGMYLICACPDSTMRDWVALPLANVGVGRGKTAEKMDIKLVRGIPMTGMVVEEYSGEPVPGVTVSASLIVHNTSGSETGASLGTGRSDANGVYRLPVLPGDVEVGANPPEGFAQNTKLQRVTIENDSLVQGVNLSVERGKTIRGVVKMPDGSPGAEAEIFCGFFTSAYTDEKGAFEIHGIRASGEIPYLACTRKRDMEASFTVNVDSMRTVEVYLHPAVFVSMEGMVVDSQEKPVSGIKVNLDGGSGMPPINYSSTTAMTDSAGRFMMDHIRVGSAYRFVVRDGFAVSESFLAGKDSGPLIITLPLADRWLEGTVRDAGGKPLADMKVNSWGRGAVQTVTDQDGRFRLDGLTDERVMLSFRGIPGQFNFQNVATNQRRDFTLPTGRHYLSGCVTDTRDRPLAGMFVKIVREEEERRPITVETDSGGQFFLSDLGQAEVTATAGGPGFLEQTQKLRTDREDVKFRLKEAGGK